MAEPEDPRLGTEIAGYRIEERIGRGGMGVVYRAQHMNLQRRAAIKIIAPEFADTKGFRSRFIREARIAAALQHPNIVTVYDAGQAGQTLYIAMQFIRGSDLAAILSEEGRLRPYRAIDVCRQVASALDAAHGMGLIHRDVKPGNVLIEGRRAYLTDFGLTKRSGATKSGLTQAGELVGTIHYVAPEQIEAGEVDARTDVYSLACLLFHCLTGHVPFERETDVAVIYAHLSEQPPKLTDVRPELPAGLDAVIAKGLDKSPDRRFQSCSDLMSAARVVIDAAGPLADTHAGERAACRSAATRRTSRPRSGGRCRSAATARRRRCRRASGARGCCSPGSTSGRRRSCRWRSARAARSSRRPRDDDLLERIRDRRPDLVMLDWNSPSDWPSRDVLDEPAGRRGGARDQGAARGAGQAGAQRARWRGPTPTRRSRRRSRRCSCR